MNLVSKAQWLYCLLGLSILSSGCGPAFPDCSNSDFTLDAYGTCVFTETSDRYPPAQVEEALRLFFEGFNRSGAAHLNSKKLQAFYESREMSITFTAKPLYKFSNGNTAVGTTTFYEDIFQSRLAVAVVANSDVIGVTALAHEMLHTVQHFLGVYDEKHPHRYPRDWFVDYNDHTGEIYPGQCFADKLEYKLEGYIVCRMTFGPTATCEPFKTR